MGKKTGRSPRSSLEERVATPAQKHFHYQGRKNNFPAGESYQKESAQERRQRLLEKFRKLEKSSSSKKTPEKQEKPGRKGK